MDRPPPPARLRRRASRHGVSASARLAGRGPSLPAGGPPAPSGEANPRRSSRFGQAVEAVGPRKRAVLARLAELWRVRFGAPGDSYRFDLIAVEEAGRSSTTPQVTHIEGAGSGVER